jgi:two-component system, OmpR family, response regulator
MTDKAPRIRILYVEDEPDIREVTRLALEFSGRFDLRICDSGDQALRESPAFKPDLILLDVMMPGMDGLTLMNRLRAESETVLTPVVFMTAKVQSTEISRYLDLGAASVIPKPFDPRTLGDRVMDILAKHNAA